MSHSTLPKLREHPWSSKGHLKPGGTRCAPLKASISEDATRNLHELDRIINGMGFDKNLAHTPWQAGATAWTRSRDWVDIGSKAWFTEFWHFQYQVVVCLALSDTKLTWTHADHSLVDRRNAMPGINYTWDLVASVTLEVTWNQQLRISPNIPSWSKQQTTLQMQWLGIANWGILLYLILQVLNDGSLVLLGLLISQPWQLVREVAMQTFRMKTTQTRDAKSMLGSQEPHPNWHYLLSRCLYPMHFVWKTGICSSIMHDSSANLPRSANDSHELLPHNEVLLGIIFGSGLLAQANDWSGKGKGIVEFYRSRKIPSRIPLATKLQSSALELVFHRESSVCDVWDLLSLEVLTMEVKCRSVCKLCG